MSKIVQWKRGNANVSSTYTGFDGEITVNTDSYNLHVHDGTTQGGHIVGNTTGNLSITNQTIAGTISNANIILQPLNNGAIRSNAQFASFGLDARLFVQTLENTNVAVITTTSRAGGNKDLYLGGNLSLPAISVNPSAPYHVGINQVYDPGFTLAVSGSTYATEYYAAANFPTGYQFTTLDGDTGISHAYQTDSNGNVSLIRIRHAGEETVRFYDNLTTSITGNLTVSQDGATYGTFPNAFVQVYSNVDSYSQFVMQNLSADPLASADIVITGDDGDDVSHYLDIGVASSTYNYPGFGIIKPDDSYILAVGDDSAGPGSTENANLILGSTNGNVKVFVGAPEDANLIASFSTTGFVPGANVTYSLGTASRQWKDLWVSNNTIYIGGVALSVDANGDLTVNGNVISGNGGGSSNYSNSNVAAYLPTYTGVIGASNVAAITRLGVNVGISNWVFDETGVLTAPGEIETVGNISAGYFIGNGAFLTGISASSNYGNANVATYLPTYTGNIAANIVKGTSAWAFDSTGNLTYPDGTKTSGNTITLANSSAYYWHFNEPAGPVRDTVKLDFNSLQTTLSNWYLSTDSTANTWILDSSIKSIGFSDSPGHSVGGRLTFGTLANLGNASANDIELSSVNSDAYVRASSRIWKFDRYGVLTLPSGNVTVDSADGFLTLETVNGGELSMNDTTGNTGSMGLEAGAGWITVNSGSGDKIWNFGGDGNLTAPTSSKITNGDGATITFNTNVARVATDAGFAYVEVQEQDLFLVANAVLISSGGQSWDFTPDGNIILPSNSSAINYRNGVSILDGISGGGTPTAIVNGNGSVSVASVDGNISFVVGGANFGHIQYGGGVAIGATAGNSNQGLSAVAIGSGAATENQGYHSVAIGWNVGQYNQGTSSIAIGENPAFAAQGNSAIAIGAVAARSGQGNYAIAMGTAAGYSGQSANTVAIGTRTGQYTQGEYGIAMGYFAANSGQSANAVAIGTYAGRDTQGQYAVAIGSLAGNNGQGGSSVAVGSSAGSDTQGVNSVAVGSGAAYQGQGNASTALGFVAGEYNQGNFAVAVGSGAAYNGQGDGAIAIGADASPINQGDYSIAIGAAASVNSLQPANSIIIDATASQLAATGAGLFVAPVRNDTGNVTNAVYYNTTTKEITYGAAGGGSSNYGNTNVAGYLGSYGSNTIVTTGNITAGNVSTSGNITFSNNNSTILFNTGAYINANAAGISREGSIVLSPAATGTFPGVVIGGAGRLLAPNGSVHQIFNSTDVTFQVATKVTAGTSSTSTSSGALQITGGAGITGNAYIGGNVVVTANNNITTSGTGNLIGNLSGTTATVTGNVTAANVTVSANVVAGNIVTTGSNGNISGVNILYANSIQLTGNAAISMPARPAMRVYGSGSTTIGANTTLTNTYFTVDYNQNNNLDATTGVFTAPVAGLYQVTLSARVGTNNGTNQVGVFKNNTTTGGANVICFWETDTNTGTATHFGMSGVANLAIGDTLRTRVVLGNIQFDGNDSWTVTYIG